MQYSKNNLWKQLRYLLKLIPILQKRHLNPKSVAVNQKQKTKRSPLRSPRSVDASLRQSLWRISPHRQNP